MNIFALTTRGLETISEAELRAVAGITVRSVAYRRIEAGYEGALVALLHLTTVDDVFIHLATWEDVTRPRDALARLRQHSQQLEIEKYLPSLKTVRPVKYPPLFSITASFVGKRNYTTAEIKHAAAAGLLAAHPHWHYAEDDRDADLNLRLFIEYETAVAGLRIGTHTLHRRPYKQHHLPGALKPSVAAAMLWVAGVEPGQILVDPFCGTGTIGIEAARQGAAAIGGDISHGALQMALDDLSIAAVYAAFFQWDARLLPLRAGSVDCVVSNLPWGKQVLMPEGLPALYGACFEEMQRVVVPGGALVLLTNAPELLPGQPEEQIEISLFGETPQIVRFRAG